MKVSKKFDLSELSKYRKPILGIATLWIVLYHSWDLNFYESNFLNKYNLAESITDFRMIGDSGVDFFLFFSAFGLYFSLKKNNVLRRFYKRRLLRIFPELLVVSMIFYSFSPCKGLFDWFSKIFLFGFYSSGLPGGNHYWYFSLIIVLYLLFPILFRIIDIWDWKGTFVLITIVVACSYGLSIVNPQYFVMIDILTVRIPIFIVGIWFGKLAYNHTQISKTFIYFSIPISIVLIVISCVLRKNWLQNRPKFEFFDRYEYFLMVIVLSVVIVFFFSIFKLRLIKNCLSLIGEYSLEIYLLYEILYLNLRTVFKSSDKIGISYTFAILSITFVLSVILKQVNNVILQTQEINYKR
ncbi:acyltransferase family protein [Fructobacillus parabroussonetiae]|uniref:Acyltransferase n=1 Tax=Fructobacillus parabroussonetiae TaxID=2713174 RepID=A0ABS5QXR0_9LACO|nr:acyltransferase [Fructobacillus parabroussonetiae]MBS9337747.1 acyltransferase [Fructobacillus parabroussonetiae]